MSASQSDNTDTWDVVVIGGGPPGENVAQYAIQGSDRTAVIVEAELVGGECSYWACMPSKALLRPVELRNAALSVPGVLDSGGKLDVDAVLRRRDAFTHNRDDESQVDWANEAGIDVIRGHGSLAAERRVHVTAPDGSTRTITARHAVVLATGTTAAIPPVPGLQEARPWTSRDATNLVEVPQSIAIIGGGVVACEAATWLNGLGADVTVIARGDRLLAGQEPFVGQLIAQELQQRGVTVMLNAQADEVTRPDATDRGVGHIRGGPATLKVAGQTVQVQELMVATGRVPASTSLGLTTVGLDPDANNGFVRTDEHLAVPGAEEWLYAVGDINGRALLTHMGKYQARIAGAVIAARAQRRSVDDPRCRDLADDRAVPGVVFTDPQAAYVGLTEAAARNRGIDTETVEYDLAAVAGASLIRDDYVGRAKLVIDRSKDTIVGATFVGTDVGELLHSATTAIVGELTLQTLWHVVPSYPTVSEVWLRLLETRGS